MYMFIYKYLLYIMRGFAIWIVDSALSADPDATRTVLQSRVLQPSCRHELAYSNRYVAAKLHTLICVLQLSCIQQVTCTNICVAAKLPH